MKTSPIPRSLVRNPIIREFRSLQRRGKRILKITPFARPDLSPHVEIHVDDGGPPYPVSVGGFRERDQFLQEAAFFLASQSPA